MYRNPMCALVLILLVSGITTTGFAYDHKRQGFIIGGGVGAGITSYTETHNYYGEQFTLPRKTEISAVTNFLIGYGASNNLLLYYTNKVSWFSAWDNIAAFGLTGLGLTYYLKPKAPSPLLNAGLGFSSFLCPFESGWGSSPWGLGFSLGAGYELSPHWSIDVDLIMGWPSNGGDVIDVSHTYNVLSVQIGISGIAY